MIAGLMQVVTSVLRTILGTANAMVPKQSKAVLAGFPDLEDSILEIARHLLARGDIKTIVLTDDNDRPPSGFAKGIIWCRRKSARGLLHFLTARYVFFTHGLYLSPNPPRSQTCVNVWHGMPIKRIGHLIGRTPPRSTFVIATSEMFKKLVGKSFGVSAASVLTTGIPRNDVMVRAAPRADAIKRRIGITGQGNSHRLIVWLPTFRRSVRGIIRTDGRAHASIFGMNDVNMDTFSSVLEEMNCTCIIKPHPMSEDTLEKIDEVRIKLWREQELTDCGVTLYEVVGAADLLITDASSVYVDYLILNKPVIIAFGDLEEYRRSRGFALEPVEQFFAGPVVATFKDLVVAIRQAFGSDEYLSRREDISNLFHDNKDDHSTARLLKRVLPEMPATP